MGPSVVNMTRGMIATVRGTTHHTPEIDDAIARTFEWFHHHSGWAPPDEATMADWLAEDLCRAPDECMTRPLGVCEHGLASWWLVLGTLG